MSRECETRNKRTGSISAPNQRLLKSVLLKDIWPSPGASNDTLWLAFAYRRLGRTDTEWFYGDWFEGEAVVDGKVRTGKRGSLRH